MTGEEDRLERVLPLVRRYGAAVVAISNDDTGISEDPDVRFAVAKKIVERAADHGIPREDVIVDPLVMPIGAMAGAGRQVFRLLRRVREELRVNTICGASNISFGLPDREGINGPFLAMAIANGLTSAITNPLLADVRRRDHGGRRPDGPRRRMRPLDPSASRPGTRRRRCPARPARRHAADGSRGQERLVGWRDVGRRDRLAVAAGPASRASASEPLVIFTPSGRRGRVDAGTTVLEAARGLGVDIDSVCGGRGICGRCQVTPGEGSFPKHGITSAASHLAPAGAVERDYVEQRRRARRPSAGVSRARARATSSSTYRRRARSTARSFARRSRSGRSRSTRWCGSISSRSSAPVLASPSSDLARLTTALEREWDLHDLEADLEVVRGAPAALAKGGYRVTVAVHDGRQLIGDLAGLHDRAFGVAIDVGSTTIAGAPRGPRTMAMCSRPTA